MAAAPRSPHWRRSGCCSTSSDGDWRFSIEREDGMGREIAINVTREETRVAVVDNNQLTDFFVDRAKRKDFVGNIYKGRVAKVLPGMQAAFIDIGMDKAAFVHVSDLSLDIEPGDTLMDADGDADE